MSINLEATVNVISYNCWRFNIMNIIFNLRGNMKGQIPNNIKFIQEHQLLLTLSDNTCQGRVFLGSNGHGTEAIKIFYDIRHFQQETQFLGMIKSPQVVKMTQFNSKGKAILDNGEEIFLPYIAMEFADCGSLFDVIQQTGSFSEEACRYFFLQLIEGLEATHKSGVSHRDIKPENILVFQKFGMKFADYGLSALTSGNDGQGTFYGTVGTNLYWAPEIHKRKYTGEKTDIFSLGIMLFIMCRSSRPFKTSSCTDQFYRFFRAGNSKYMEKYWAKMQMSSHETNSFSEPIKKLFEGIFQYNPESRPTLQQLKECQWMQGPKATKQQVQVELKLRSEIMISKSKPDSLLKNIKNIRNKFEQSVSQNQAMAE